MKPPISIAWLPGLLMLGTVCASDCLAQNETNRLATTPISETPRSTQTIPPGAKPSRWTTDIMRLAQSGIDEGVILAFVENSGAFSLTAEHIVQLNELGVSTQIISAMLRHDRELALGQGQLVKAGESGPATAFDQATTTDQDADKKAYLEMADAAGKTLLPESKPRTPEKELAALSSVTLQNPEPTSPPVPNQSAPAPPKKKKLYPVREPYPVELTAPIVFLDSPSF